MWTLFMETEWWNALNIMLYTFSWKSTHLQNRKKKQQPNSLIRNNSSETLLKMSIQSLCSNRNTRVLSETKASSPTHCLKSAQQSVCTTILSFCHFKAITNYPKSHKIELLHSHRYLCTSMNVDTDRRHKKTTLFALLFLSILILQEHIEKKKLKAVHCMN